MALETAKSHFDEDMARAEVLLAHAANVQPASLKDDILRGAWMTASGAADAFFCDAYADLMSRVLRAKDLQKIVTLPDKLSNMRVPVIAVIREAGGWRWRMAARELMAKESVLSLKDVKGLLRSFCRADHLLLTEDTVEHWITHAKATKRLWGITRTNYLNLSAANKNKERPKALKHVERRVDAIFQRRHDCIHCCDRPKTAVQSISADLVQKAIADLSFVVDRCHDDLVAEFPQYLQKLGFSGATRNQVGA